MQSKILSITKQHRGSIYGRFTWFSAAPDGGPILVEDGTWWDVNGFMIQTKNVRTIVVFKRWGHNA